MITSKKVVLKCFYEDEYEEKIVYPSNIKDLKKINQLTSLENNTIYTNYFKFK